MPTRKLRIALAFSGVAFVCLLQWSQCLYKTVTYNVCILNNWKWLFQGNKGGGTKLCDYKFGAVKQEGKLEC